MMAAIRTIDHEVGSYLAEVLAAIVPLPSPSDPDPIDDMVLANELFTLITSRAFCYLGRHKTQCYRDDVLAMLRRRMSTGGALRFFYDIGPGYHATTRPGILPLTYDVGLSELLILSQINTLCRCVVELYPPGAHFFLVIDNLCGLRTNDIPLELTEGYVRKFRQLIEKMGIANRVDLIVESEEFDLEEYDRLLRDVEVEPPHAAPSPQAIDNVARFLGRPITAAEAAERIERYRRTCCVTNYLFDRLINDVHMTQRATGATLGFRPFPGGDQRTQVGELVLCRNSKGRLSPLLLTSRNVDRYDCVRLEFSHLLPAPMTHVTFASACPPSCDPGYAK